MFMTLLRGYNRLLVTHPWKTQLITTGVLMSGGDLIAQTAVEKKKFKDVDLNRNRRFFLYGTFIIGPTLKTWYMLLNRFIIGAPAAKTFKMVAVDQGLFAPSFCAFFLFTMTYWKTYSVEESKEKVIQDYKDVIITNWKLWPAAQVINFYFIPLDYRLLYVNCVALIWNSYLAYKTEQGKKVEESSPYHVEIDNTASR